MSFTDKVERRLLGIHVGDFKPQELKADEIVPGYYLALGSDQGLAFHFKVRNYPAKPHGQWPEVATLCVWGLSLWEGSVAYRTLGTDLETWLVRRANAEMKIYTDMNWEALLKEQA